MLRRLRVLWPFTPGWARRLLWSLLGVPLAAAYAGLFVGLGASIVFAVQGIGIVLFIALLATARGLGGLEHRLARRLLSLEPAAQVLLRDQRGDPLRRLRALVLSSSTWRTVAWLGARVPYGAAVAATVGLGTAACITLVVDGPWQGWAARPLLLAPALALVLLLTLVALDLQARIAAAVGRRVLGSDPERQVALLREQSQRLSERNRLARDLHDTIGHSLTASLLQASAARRTLAPGPDGDPHDLPYARQALEHIENNTRKALAELDRALSVLREDTDGNAARGDAADDEGGDLAALPGLLAGLRDGGLPVTLRAQAPLQDVPLPVSRLAYRLVQEGTTNVLRHAGCPRTTVEVVQADSSVTVSVRNDAPTEPLHRPGPGGGRGLHGLRERTGAIGGSFTAGATADGGYEVRATLPLRVRT